MTDPRTLAVSVVDEHPRFFCEAVLWTLCVKTYSKFEPALVVVGEMPQSLTDWFRSEGVALAQSKTLLAESPHCNKLIPGKIFHGQRFVVTDCDVFMLRDFGFMLKEHLVRCPENNHCNPPKNILEKILRTHGLKGPFEPGLSLFTGNNQTRETLASNISAGVIWVPPSLQELWIIWEEKARWLIKNRDIMGDYKVHVDQVAFAIMLEEQAPWFRHLPAQTNTILHLLPFIKDPYALHLTSGHIPHFPKWFDEIGQLRIDQINENLAAPLRRFNDALKEARAVLSSIPETREFLDNFMNPNWKR